MGITFQYCNAVINVSGAQTKTVEAWSDFCRNYINLPLICFGSYILIGNVVASWIVNFFRVKEVLSFCTVLLFACKKVSSSCPVDQVTSHVSVQI